MLKTKLFYLLLILFPISPASQAQIKKRQPRAKTPDVKAETHIGSADRLYESMLSSTARILFIDSVVADKSDFLDKIPLNKESGMIGTYDDIFSTSGNLSSFVYINEFGNKMFFSISDDAGQHRLYSADKLDGQWTNRKSIDEFGDEFEDINYPFMMSDGVTLYFSAKSKNGLGGYDIYVTMYDADSARFYKPENIGLPYNSKANDYYCIIDEFDEIGWLVTDRNQPEGKVCIYVFAPSSSREVYDGDAIGEVQLRNLAGITSIKDTWTDEKQLAAARVRLARLLHLKDESKADGIRFIVNDDTVYSSIEDFKSSENRERFIELSSKKKAFSAIAEKLDIYRKQYSLSNIEGKRRLTKTIKDLEEKYETFSLDISSLEKEIRNAENRLVGGK